MDEVAREFLRRAIKRETQRKVAARIGVEESNLSLIKRSDSEQAAGDRRYVRLEYLDAYARSFTPPRTLGSVLQELADLAKEMEWAADRSQPVAVDLSGSRVVLAPGLAPEPDRGGTGSPQADAGPRRAAGSAPPPRPRKR